MKSKNNNKILLLVSIFAISNTNFINIGNATSLSEQKQELTNKLNETKDALNDKENEQNSVLAEIKKLDLELSQAEQELAILENELEETRLSLAISEEELKDAQAQRLEQYESLKSRVNVMYKYGDSGYLEILLDAKGFADFFKRIEYINYIMQYDQTLLDRYQEIEDFISQKVEQIKTQKANIEILVKKSEEKRVEAEKKLVEKQELGKKIESEAATLEQQLSDLEAESEKVQKLINEAEAAAAAAAAAAASSRSISSTSGTSNSYTGSVSNNKIYPSSSAKLAHPVPAYSSSAFNDSYGPRTNPISGRSEVHAGLDLRATYNTDIVAAEDGTVTYAAYNNGGYGYMVMINHGNGLTTLYAHNASLVVSNGQQVKRGQVIAKAGSTGYSTGVHCHFEVRVNGSHVNPVPYLQ